MKSSRARKLVQAEREAREWLDHVAMELGEQHRPRAYSALRATLHAVRDCLPYDDVMKIAETLPALLRGTLLEGWHPAGAGRIEAAQEPFLDRVAEYLLGVSLMPPQAAAQAVFRVLQRRASRGLPPSIEPLRPSGRIDPPPDGAERARDDVRTALEQAQAEGVSPDDLPQLRDPVHAPGRPPSPRAGQAEVLQSSLEKGHAWVRELDEAMLFGNPDLAFSALCGVLRALRDRLSRDEAFHLSSQLPLALVGFVFDAAPDPKAAKERSRGEFLARVARELQDAPDLRPEEAVRAVFGLLGRHVTEGELEDVRGRLPAPVRTMWPSERARSRQHTLGRISPSRPTATRHGDRGRARKAKRKVRSALARARARGVPERDLPALAPRRRR